MNYSYYALRQKSFRLLYSVIYFPYNVKLIQLNLMLKNLLPTDCTNLHHSGATLHHQSDVTTRSTAYLPTDPSYAVSVSSASAALQSQVVLNWFFSIYFILWLLYRFNSFWQQFFLIKMLLSWYQYWKTTNKNSTFIKNISSYDEKS